MNTKQKKLLVRIVVAAAFWVPLFLISEGILKTGMPRWALFGLFLIPYLTVGYDILRKAFLGIRNGKVFDECFLMTVATAGAIALGEYGEGVAVMLLYQVGELFQSYAVGHSRRNIAALMDISRTTPTSSRRTARFRAWTPTRWRSAPSSSSSLARRCRSTASSRRARPR